MLRTKRSAQAFRFGDRGGNLTDATPNTGNRVQELAGEQRVAIMDEVELAVQDAIRAVREIAPYLIHPEPISVVCDFSDLHPAGQQLDKEQHYEPLQNIGNRAARDLVAKVGQRTLDPR